MSKLTKEQILEIQTNPFGLSQRALARQFKVRQSTISYYVNPISNAQAKARALKSWNNKTPEQKKAANRTERRKAYMRKYINNRYHNDPEFNKKFRALQNERHRLKRQSNLIASSI